jgi:hypothetical protein
MVFAKLRIVSINPFYPFGYTFKGMEEKVGIVEHSQGDMP